MRRSSLLLTVFVASVALTSCRQAGQLPEVVDVRDVSASRGQPEISSIVDLGAVSVPSRGRLSALHRDGSAVIGELLLIEGSGFGKQPTVSISGRAAAVLARVEGGGIVVRVPWGIDPGQVEVEVSSGNGRDHRAFSIRRVGLVATGRSLWPLQVAADGTVTAGQEMPLPGAEDLAISSEGAAAYVAGQVSASPRLRVIDLAAGRPAVVSEHPLQGTKVIAVVTAEQAPLGLVLTDTHLHVFDTSDPLQPAFFEARPLSGKLLGERVLAASLGGQGKLLALLLAESNRVAVLEVHDRARLGTPVILEVLPGNPLNLVQDVCFSADEGSLWVSSGDGPRSIGSGVQPLQMSLFQVQHEPLRLVLHKAWELGEREAPRQLAVARGEPMPPGTVIRAEPSDSAVYLAVVASDWLRPGVGRPPAGAVLRTTPGQPATRLLVGPHLITAVEVVGKTQIVLALGAQAGEKNVLSRVLLSRRAWEQEQPHVLPLGSVDMAGTPPWLGRVRAQP